MFDFASVFENFMKPNGNRIQVITNGGGYGILSVDAISKDKNLKIAEMSKKTFNILKKEFPPLVSVGNPIDLVGDATTERYRIAIEQCIRDKQIDILLIIALYQTPLITTDIVDLITEYNDLKKKPIVVVSTGGEFTEHLMESLGETGVTSFTFPEEAVKAIIALVEYYTK